MVFLSIQTMKNNNIAKLKEPLFVSQVVEKVLCPFLNTDGCNVFLQGYVETKLWAKYCHIDILTLLYRSTDESIGSKKRRGKVGRIPDLSLLVKSDNSSAMPFLCEVKSPSHMKDLRANSCQNPDFIKLCNMLKDELDHMGGIDLKVVYGLLVEGSEHFLKTGLHMYVNLIPFF